MFNRRLVVMAAALVFAGVACGIGAEAPGEGAKAEKGYELGAAIIAALDAYHADAGEYPDALDQLVPNHMDAIPSGELIERFGYRRTDESYELFFNYIGPGNNFCFYFPEDGEWGCSGFY
jgi:hypothetical protein